MRSNTSLLFSILTLLLYSEKWLCLGQTTVCGNTIPFNVSAGLYEPPRFYQFGEGCVTDKTITDITVISPVEVFEEDTFVDLPLLSDLFLNRVGIREVKPGFIKNVPVLKRVDLMNNQIKIIETGVFGGRFNNLENLYITDNKISEIQKAAFSNFSANALELNKNQLSLVGDWFGNTFIERLDLSQNSITSLKQDAFEKIQNLKYVTLYLNKIQFIEPGTFTKQGVMDLIDLSHNFLYNINFIGEINLDRLDISYNKISSLQLSEKTEIKTIVIYPNPWNCLCLHKFWKLARKRKILYTFDLFYGMKKTAPLCIYRDKCDEQHIDFQLQEEFYKNFSTST